MGKESLYSKDSRLVFRETFSSFEDIANKKGVVSTAGSTVLLSGGIVTFPSGGGNIYYDRTLAELPSGNEAWTVRIKAKPTTQGVAYPKLVSIAIGGKQYGIVYEVSTGKIATLHNNGSSDAARFTSGGHFVVDQWIEITVTHTLNDNTPLIYVNGSLVSMAASLGGANPIVYNNRLRLANGIDTVSNYPFRGDMEFVEVYNATLTATEVSELYKKTLYTEPNLIGNTVLDINPNLGNFSDKYGNTVVNNGITLVKDKNIFVGKCTGIGGLVINPFNSLSGVSECTINQWIKPSIYLPSVGIDTRPFEYRSTTQENILLISFINASGANRLDIELNNVLYKLSDTTIALGAPWFMVTVVYKGGQYFYYYKNGVFNSSNTTSIAATLTTTGTKSLRIGDSVFGSDYYYRDKIGRTQVFNKALSQSEITRLYNSQKHLYI